jgi:predicted transcriptional regulator
MKTTIKSKIPASLGIWLITSVCIAFGVETECLAKIPLGTKPPRLVLSGGNGGQIDGKPWDSWTLQDKLWLMFYVDPDKRDENLEFEKAIKEGDFDHSKVKSVGMINFAATWLPDMVLASSLKAKQKDYPETVYVKDLSKRAVSTWQLEDDAYNFLIFDTKGQLIYSKSGRISPAETKEIVSLIKKNIP